MLAVPRALWLAFAGMNNLRITWKGAGLVAFALFLTYLGHQVLRDAAKETGVDGVLLGMLVTAGAAKLPPLPDEQR